MSEQRGDSLCLLLCLCVSRETGCTQHVGDNCWWHQTWSTHWCLLFTEFHQTYAGHCEGFTQ